MAEDPAQKAARILAKTAANLKAANARALNDAGLAAKRELLSELDRVVSGRRLRGVGRSGAKLNVGFEVNTGTLTCTVRARGPWQLVERGNRPHVIQPRRRRGKRALSFDGRAYARVRHPGTRGKHPWEKGFTAAAPKVHKVLDERYRKAARDAWT